MREGWWVPEKVQEGEERLVGEAHSKGNAIQENSHVPCYHNIFHLKEKYKRNLLKHIKNKKGRTNDIGNVKVDRELGWSLLLTSHDKRERDFYSRHLDNKT